MRTSLLPEDLFSVRSDKLRELRASLTYLRKLNYPIGAVAKFSLVVDTNIILGELRWLVARRSSNEAKSSLMEIVEAETVELYAPPALFEEVEEKIPLLAAAQGLDGEAMRLHWQAYKERITLVVPDEGLVRPLRSGADPDDAEFVALEKMLGADGVLSKDRHISMMGGNRISLDCVFRLRNYSRAAAVELNIRVAGVHFAIVGFVGIRACLGGIKALGAGIRNAPDWLKAALLLTALLTLAQPRARAKVLETISGILDGFASATPSLVKLVSDVAHTAQLNQGEAKKHLDEALAELARTERSGTANW